MSARRPGAWPLVPLYRAAVALRWRLYTTGLLKTRWAGRPTVCVGSLSAGGAGKTPVVIALVRLLQGRGWDVDVLSRGYGRAGKGVEQVNPQAEDAARRYGDEPVMIARAAGVAVWVGADRIAAARATEEQSAAAATEETVSALMGARRAHVLDDGFQHWQMNRDADVVLVTAEDLDDALLPAGNLRQGLSALRRAEAVVVREEEIEQVKPRVWRYLREGAQLWVVRRRLDFPAPLFVFGAGLRPVAFCAIARPEGFQSMLIASGCGVIETVAFADHHAFTMEDMDEILAVGRRLNATGFVTTEKDAVKLTTAMRARLEELGAVMVARLEAQFADAESVADELESRLLAASGEEPGGRRL